MTDWEPRSGATAAWASADQAASLSTSTTGPGLLVMQDDIATGAAGAALDTRVGEVGATWTQHPAYVGTPHTGAVRVSNQSRLYSADVDAAPLYYASGVPPYADYFVRATLTGKSFAGGGAAILGRLQLTSDPVCYRAAYSHSALRWELYVRYNAAWVLLSTFTNQITLNQAYRVELRMSGNSIKVLVDGTERIAVSNSSVTLAGYAGVRYDAGTATDSTGLHLSALRAETLYSVITVASPPTTWNATGGVATTWTPTDAP